MKALALLRRNLLVSPPVAALLYAAVLVVLLWMMGSTIAAVLAQIAPHLNAQTIVTDVGSTKRDVIGHARRYLGDAFARFVPAHPIAGTEKSGAAFRVWVDANNPVIRVEVRNRSYRVRARRGYTAS